MRDGFIQTAATMLGKGVGGAISTAITGNPTIGAELGCALLSASTSAAMDKKADVTDLAISAIGAGLGQTFISIPIVGGLIGSWLATSAKKLLTKSS